MKLLQVVKLLEKFNKTRNPSEEEIEYGKSLDGFARDCLEKYNRLGGVVA